MKNLSKFLIFSLWVADIFCMEIEGKKDWNVLTPEGMHKLLNKDFRHPRKIIDEYLDYNCQNDPEYQVFKDELVKKVCSLSQIEKIPSDWVRKMSFDPKSNCLIGFATSSSGEKFNYRFQRIPIEGKTAQTILSLDKSKIPACFTYALKKQLLCYVDSPFGAESTIRIFDVYKKNEVDKILDVLDITSMCFNSEETMLFFSDGSYISGYDLSSKKRCSYRFKTRLEDIHYNNKNNKLLCVFKDSCLLWDWQKEFGYNDEEKQPDEDTKYYIKNGIGDLIKLKSNEENSTIYTHNNKNVIALVHYDDASDQYFTTDYNGELKVWDGKIDKVKYSFGLNEVIDSFAYDKERNVLFGSGHNNVYVFDLARYEQVFKKLENPNLRQYYALLGIAKNRILKKPKEIVSGDQLEEIFKDYPEILRILQH